VALIKQSRHRRGLKAHTIWFDAWKYDKEQELWRALLMRVLEAVRAVAAGQPTSEYDELLIPDPERLARLEAYFREERRREAEQAARRAELASRERPEVAEEVAEAEARPRVEKALEPFAARHALRQLLTLHAEGEPDANFADMPAGQLRDYIYLTRATAVPVPDLERRLAIPVPEMVAVPPGPFTMGTLKKDIRALVEKYGGQTEWYEREVPQHELDLPAFEIGKYPVTSREYQAFVRGAGYRPPEGWDGDEYPAGKGDHPVVNVSWQDAVAYCRWLSEQTKRSFRLPTEAEWEKAARGTDGRQYPWGNEFDSSRCNTSEGQSRGTTPVGQYPTGASPYGALDMAGNVWEWCSSLHKPYPYDPGDGRENPEEGGVRVLRGGSWDVRQISARCAYRNRCPPDLWFDFVGFRCARGSE
jgi:formylglycine-generating enzyme required for sulfatase activity